MDFSTVIRSIPDYPKKGVIFRDMTTLLGHPRAFVARSTSSCNPMRACASTRLPASRPADSSSAERSHISSRSGSSPSEKKGKLPWNVLGEDYALEYGTDRIEIHQDAVKMGEQVIVVDDLIATGGTCFAAIKLLEQAGAEVVGCSFVIDLPDLGGADKIRALGKEVTTLVTFAGH